MRTHIATAPAAIVVVRNGIIEKPPDLEAGLQRASGHKVRHRDNRHGRRSPHVEREMKDDGFEKNAARADADAGCSRSC